ncbi:amino acid/amide ABC transporter membrane protein 1, HAAT family [Micromonospora pallida]|uniref:Amino acid/amide ABC transporter membrane protein 1, HAAT family n=1 Tax=Micromonospora pallida TaxID=145854 RepID=A0A1C6RSN8_9ACTN|nr:branched-chain amino acid ABC transporter permease [Micromonospora pallida]SCL20053.1 amino acid/amide ABC transporter membrane protein 1, HAAT family [Micromonospora pallida]
MDKVLQIIVTGLGAGAIYAIIGMGFNVVFKATRVVNFAHGQYLVVAGVLASTLQRTLGWPLIPTILVVLVVGTVLGLATDAVAIRMLRRPDPITVTIATVAVGIVIEAVVLKVTAGKTYGLDEWPGLSFPLGPVTVSSQTTWNILLAGVLAFLVHSFFTRTRRGIALQAGADDPATATLFGVSHSTTTFWTFGIAGLLGGIAGLAMTPVTLVAFSTGFLFALKGFTAAILGGLGSTKGALVGGLIIGLTEALVATYFSSTYAPAVAFGVLLVVLVFRPSGLFKELAVERV